MLARRLRRHGADVMLAANGLEALKLMRAQPLDVVLLDLIMPGFDGLQVLTKMKADAGLRHVPVIMISALDQEDGVARCIEMGAEDYLAKPFNPVFLRARIGACLERKRLRDQERAALEALKQSQKILSAELADAAAYVRSLLPPPLQHETLRVDWRFQPSTQLGGDAFGYHWLDPQHVAFYVLDVCGHGVGAALLSVSVMNVLRNRSIPNVDFADPAAVLAALNQSFSMERHNNMFFTIWYGVIALDTRELTFACGGHPPAVLLDPLETSPVMMRAPGTIIGGFPEAKYAGGNRSLKAGSRVYLFSDGLYELARENGTMVQLDEFIGELGKPSVDPKLDEVMRWATAIRAGAGFEDDISILELVVP
jgi:sigma-B regulation protein RsbU (phosphoserine phosphatase)